MKNSYVPLVASLALFLTFSSAPAQTLNVLYNFTGDSDGGNPLAGLTIDKNGDLFGTAEIGGTLGYGTAFKLAKSGSSWTFVPLYNFASNTDGSYPSSKLVPGPGGELYGVTSGGGGAGGAGVVFSLSGGPTETVLYRFTTGADAGEPPSCNLMFDKAGNIYGTTSTGGTNGLGTVFRLVKPQQTGGAWTETVLYNFGSGTDGATPIAGVTFDAAGNLYGTTSAGGTYGYGTIFELSPSKTGWTETIIHNFQYASDGSVPYGGLIADKSGNMYGTATQGGTGGGGTVYELTPATGGGWTFNVIYGIVGWGISGTYRNLYLDAAGNLYGTTHCDGPFNGGTIYKLTPSNGSWTYTELYDFTGGSDGGYVFSSLAFDPQGNIYGTTQIGGSHGYGVIWQFVP